MTDINKRLVHRRLTLGPFEFVRDTVGSGTIDRWIVHLRGVGALRLHRINKSDVRHCHDHRIDFTSLILWRGYVEWRPGHLPRRWWPGQAVRRRAEDVHRLELVGGPAWTIQLSGPQRRDWQFYVPEGAVPAEHYDFYAKHGWEKTQRLIKALDKVKKVVS